MGASDHVFVVGEYTSTLVPEAAWTSLKVGLNRSLPRLNPPIVYMRPEPSTAAAMSILGTGIGGILWSQGSVAATAVTGGGARASAMGMATRAMAQAPRLRRPEARRFTVGRGPPPKVAVSTCLLALALALGNGTDGQPSNSAHWERGRGRRLRFVSGGRRRVM